ncbi:MAG: acyl-CoA dehydrogenase, partial [Myxococcales bacterium]|nr:acyl-CoA dehydrogenase [Myxococcales bacterium]
GAFEDMDEETARNVLLEVEKLAKGPFAESFEPGDRTPLALLDGDVTLPPSVRSAVEAFYEADWQGLELPPHLGGVGAPPSLRWAAFEMLWGGNSAATFYLLGTFVAALIDELGTDAQKSRYVNNMIDGHWGATMVLTEPDAGSDVGAGRTTAKHLRDDVWELEGTKRFITNGDYDGPANIVHLVLARPTGAQPGTKGLSLFVVPKYWVDETGAVAERNGAVVTGIEKKMGLSASATCELTLGGGEPCRGLLLGDVHDGIRQMFHVIEYARMSIGLKSMSTMSTAYLNALEYTKERVQGPNMKHMTDKEAPRVRIIEHPDVRRMLMLQKSHAEGMRALIYFGARLQDEVASTETDDARAVAARKSDLLLPIIKAYCSEKTYELLGVSLQTFGGSGFCKDYPVEQYIRDQKIDTLYEGTTHIQALDLFFRKVARDQGQTLQALLSDAAKLVAEERGGSDFAGERARLAKALGVMQESMQTALGRMQESVYWVGLHANRLLESLAELLIAYLLLDQAVIANEKLGAAGEPDAAFYQGKVASARFFASSVLPKLDMRLAQLKGSDLSLMELDEAAF